MALSTNSALANEDSRVNAFFSSLFTGLAVILTMMTLVWLLSVVKRDVSIVDIFWGLGFVVLNWFYRVLEPEITSRHTLLLALVTIWGFRLALYLLWRNWGHDEDPRYQAMRQYRGNNFWWMSLFTIFFLQGVLIWIIATPLFVVQLSAGPPLWTWTDVLGLLFWGIGFFFETVGDLQLARFKADPANRGRVMRTGLWAYTRHPNYFGDAMVWWGYFLLALAVPGSLWTILGPVLMTVLLLKVSGVALLEQTITERRPEYRDYIKHTNAFLPWFPRQSLS
jgi:steroid 5-alpha reductase family enzyme